MTGLISGDIYCMTNVIILMLFQTDVPDLAATRIFYDGSISRFKRIKLYFLYLYLN